MSSGSILKIELPIEGYWRDKAYLPTYGGIYFVYAAKVNANRKIAEKRLLYVGESDDIYVRHNGTKDAPSYHDHYMDFKSALQQDEVLRYLTAKYSGPEPMRRMIQDAIIYRTRPLINEKSTQSYTGESVEISFTTTDGIVVPDTVRVEKGESRG